MYAQKEGLEPLNKLQSYFAVKTQLKTNRNHFVQFLE